MTEDEAKTKWCPAYRVATSGGDLSTYETDNRPRDAVELPEPIDNATHAPGPNINPWARCIGSACMAWRWQTKEFEDALERYEDSWNIGGIASRERPVCQGYCGLAGAPQ